MAADRCFVLPNFTPGGFEVLRDQKVRTNKVAATCSHKNEHQTSLTGHDFYIQGMGVALLVGGLMTERIKYVR